MLQSLLTVDFFYISELCNLFYMAILMYLAWLALLSRFIALTAYCPGTAKGSYIFLKIIFFFVQYGSLIL